MKSNADDGRKKSYKTGKVVERRSKGMFKKHTMNFNLSKCDVTTHLYNKLKNKVH